MQRRKRRYTQKGQVSAVVNEIGFRPRPNPRPRNLAVSFTTDKQKKFYTDVIIEELNLEFFGMCASPNVDLYVTKDITS